MALKRVQLSMITPPAVRLRPKLPYTDTTNQSRDNISHMHQEDQLIKDEVESFLWTHRPYSDTHHFKQFHSFYIVSTGFKTFLNLTKTMLLVSFFIAKIAYFSKKFGACGPQTPCHSSFGAASRHLTSLCAPPSQNANLRPCS